MDVSITLDEWEVKYLLKQLSHARNGITNRLYELRGKPGYVVAERQFDHRMRLLQNLQMKLESVVEELGDHWPPGKPNK